MPIDSSQAFVGRNRAPRVHITYGLDVAGEKAIDLPFVMGVMADLSGKPESPLAPVADRSFMEIDVDNFDERLKKIRPRVAFQVENTLAGDGTNIPVDITFENMDGFGPAAVARKIKPLADLLELRARLSEMLTKMDGKAKAEELLGQMLDPELLKSLLAAKTGTTAAAATAETGGK